MAIILIAIVLAVITGLNYFGKPISRTMWLVLFILSAVAPVPVLLAYLHFLPPGRPPQLRPNIFPSDPVFPPTKPAKRRSPHTHPAPPPGLPFLASGRGIL